MRLFDLGIGFFGVTIIMNAVDSSVSRLHCLSHDLTEILGHRGTKEQCLPFGG
jgi:hypothetical protein